MKHYINEARKKKEDETTLGGHVDEIIDPQEVKAAEKVLDKPVVEEDPDEIFTILDEVLKINKRNIRNAAKQAERTGKTPKVNYSNVLFVGEAGSGKTSRIQAWAESRGINLVLKQASTMDDLDVGGGGAVNADRTGFIKLSTDEFDQLVEVPNSVLFLDELNRASARVRGNLLTLIQDHTIPDGKGTKFLSNMLFTIAAINPSAAAMGYSVDELDPAELSRFGIYDIVSDPKTTLNYFKKLYAEELQDAEDDEEKLIALRKTELATKILTNKNFKFDSGDEIADLQQMGKSALNARSLTTLLDISNGEKNKFINLWPKYCNPNKWKDIKAILADYEDPNLDDFEEVDDKATQVLKKKPEKESKPKGPSDVFKQTLSREDFDNIIANTWKPKLK